jgi:adenylate kinase
MNIILFGPPGAGKGTQAQHIVKNYKYFQISTGDLLRNEIKKKTTLGEDIEKIISKGEFVSDSVVNILLKNAIKNLKFKDKIIFDGYPRNLLQVENLKKNLIEFKQNIGAIIFLNVTSDIIEKRIMGRVTCERCNMTLNKYLNPKEIESHPCGRSFLKKRKDDGSEIAIYRYDTYMEKTKPVLDFYSNGPDFHEIDGSLEIQVIKGKIEQILKV